MRKYIRGVFLSGILFFAGSVFADPKVQITVQPSVPSFLQNEYYSYNFGTVPQGFSRYADFVLSVDKKETSPSYIKSVEISGMAYWAWHNCPEVLNPGEKCYATVEFRPPFDSPYSGTLLFRLKGQNIFIDLFGWGSRI